MEIKICFLHFIFEHMKVDQVTTMCRIIYVLLHLSRRIINPTADELARHCRRHVRSVEEAERLVQEHLDHYAQATDTMGVKLIYQAGIAEIWRTQRRHLHCIQNLLGLQLYMRFRFRTREIIRGGGVSPCLPLCTRLHLHQHLNNFIPGKCLTSACVRSHLYGHFQPSSRSFSQASQPTACTSRCTCWKD